MKNWIAVASAEHVRVGRKGGFMQVCHGKEAPLRRISPGDMVAYYSPTEVLGRKDGLQSFTAIGRVQERAPYQATMHGGAFHPFRRDVTWFEACEVPIRPLLERLEFTRGKRNWGYQMRFGLFEVCAGDMRLVGEAMKATEPEPV